jgi:hypothetical protein
MTRNRYPTPGQVKLDLAALIARARASSQKAVQHILVVRAAPAEPRKLGSSIKQPAVLAVAAALCLPGTAQAQSLTVEPQLTSDLNIGLWLTISLMAAVALLFAYKYASSRAGRTWFGYKHIMGTKTNVLLIPIVLFAVYASGSFPLSPGKPIAEVGSFALATLPSLIWAIAGYCLYTLRHALGTFRGAIKSLAVIGISLVVQTHAVFEGLAHFINLDRLAAIAMLLFLFGALVLFILNRIGTLSMQRS